MSLNEKSFWLERELERRNQNGESELPFRHEWRDITMPDGSIQRVRAKVYVSQKVPEPVGSAAPVQAPSVEVVDDWEAARWL